MAIIKIPWYKFADEVKDLKTDVAYQLQVIREAIPLIFVPGLMGTRLRVKKTKEMRWDPSWPICYIARKYCGQDGAYRKKRLVGDRFDANYLEPVNDDPIGDGFKAIMAAYCTGFLNGLKKPGAAVASAVGGNGDWGPLSKIFEFPVYAFGYNWTDDNAHSGAMLVNRIEKIIEEARGVTGLCEKVILITHSMGGLVARWASKAGAESSILGIIHGVQPATGAPSAYWRMKAGFEGDPIVSAVFGSTGPTVTPLFANCPSILQLLPNKLHRTNGGANDWLRITNSNPPMAFPASNPYKEIYEVPAEVRPAKGKGPSSNKYWGLVDRDLLDPGHLPPASPDDDDPAAWPDDDETDAQTQTKKPLNKLDEMDIRLMPRREPWDDYIHWLKAAEEFHDVLGNYQHPKTFNLRGIGSPTADVVELKVESVWVNAKGPYPRRGFRGLFRNSKGGKMRAVLQQPAGDGDGTVPESSAGALNNLDGKELPGDQAAKVPHQEAYADAGVQKFAIEAIKALCRVRYEEKSGRKLGKFPAP